LTQSKKGGLHALNYETKRRKFGNSEPKGRRRHKLH
jgi:hypothetical protein